VEDSFLKHDDVWLVGSEFREYATEFVKVSNTSCVECNYFHIDIINKRLDVLRSGSLGERK
jgi:hypothetical protein